MTLIREFYYDYYTITLHIQYQSLKLLDMKLDENILKTCQGLVMNCNCLERTIICGLQKWI